MSQYLEFHRLPYEGKTELWAVGSKRSGELLGMIRWYGPWRQYVFEPEPETVWNPTCLLDVNGKIRELMAARQKVTA